MTGTMIQPAQVRVLDATDRCDRCGAQSYVAAILEGGSELLFCGHHWREHGDAVCKIAVDVHDETEHLA